MAKPRANDLTPTGATIPLPLDEPVPATAGNGAAADVSEADAEELSSPSPPDPKHPKYGRRQAPANVEKLPPKLSCGTASGRGFFVAHPDQDMRPLVMLTKPDGNDLDEEDWFLVDREAEDDLSDVGTMYELTLCRTANGGYFLWRIKCEEPGGRVDGYTESAREALEEFAGERWIKLKGDRRARAFEVIRGSPAGNLRWPEFDIDDLVRRAFKGRLVTDENHPLVKRLRGDI